MRQLLLASKNKGKIKEITEILKDIPFELKTLNDIGFSEEIQETGKSFEENATLKARAVGERTEILTMAEDSGLEVDALGGRPGILSARYTKGSDEDRCNKLLDELKGIPKEKRTARFKAVVALYIPTPVFPSVSEGSLGLSELVSARDSSTSFHFARNDNSYRIITFEGVSEGYITDKPIGRNGFGYDPIFFNPDLGKTNAQVPIEEKNNVSHRARAFKKCRKYLLQFGRNS